ncbi:MAG: TetR family transcriptional regulator C-terminal domain-containing protein [Desulfobacterales bacterium]|jgi:TetR/AcrR family transcriptional repressor of bet genes
MVVNKKPGIITRAEQKQHTRQKLIEATMAVISSEGFSGVTMAKVAEKAGLSRGIGNFHFQSKEQLLLETLHNLYMEFENGWRNAVADAGSSPVDQLKELIKTTLQPPIADFKKVAVWLAYWGEAPSRKKYLAICAAHDREWDGAVENILRLLVDDEFNSHGMTLAKIAHSLTAMMDGFWVEYLIADGRYTPDDAVKACFAFLASFFPGFR